MSEKLRSGLITLLVIASFLGWQFYSIVTRVSDIERAEFRILYSNARDRLDVFSLCRPASIPDLKTRTESQIELQKQFAALKATISDSRFLSDQKLLDLEIQLKDQNQQTGMEDQAVRCGRLSMFAVTEEQDIVRAISRVEQFLDKY